MWNIKPGAPKPEHRQEGEDRELPISPILVPSDPEEILRREGCSAQVIRHSRAVCRRALAIASRLTIPTDLTLLRAGALLHDLGRSHTGGIEHAAVGAGMAERLGFAPELVRIIRTHVGAGILPAEAAELGLPPGDYVPRTPEEKIVAHADNLTQGNRAVTFEQAYATFERRLGKDSPALQRVKQLREEIRSWRLTEDQEPDEISCGSEPSPCP